MKTLINRLTSDKILLRGFSVSILLEIITNIYIAINYNSLPPYLPIFNQLPWGDQRFTQIFGIFIPSIIFILIFLFNLILATVIYFKNPLIARVVAATTFLISVMHFIFVIRTILVIL